METPDPSEVARSSLMRDLVRAAKKSGKKPSLPFTQTTPCDRKAFGGIVQTVRGRAMTDQEWNGLAVLYHWSRKKPISTTVFCADLDKLA
jgi:hypothetical protein